MRGLEELMIRKKSYEEIAIFLDVSIGWVSECMSRPTPRKLLREADSFKDLILTKDDDAYLIKDIDYIKNNDEEYYKYLLRNDYINNDR